MSANDVVLARPRATTGRPVTLVGLILYGMVLAVLAGATLDTALPTSNLVLQGSRQTLLASSIDVLNHGGPPLLASSLPYTRAKNMHPAPVYAANVGDDEGIYLYLPLAGHFLHVENPLVLLKWFFILLMGALILVYPLIFYGIFGSLTAAAAAPWFVAYRFLFLRNTDIYWMPAWILLLCIPLLLLALRQRHHQRSAIALLLGADVLASFGTSVRSGAGTPILIASLGVAYLVVRTWRRRLALAVALGLADVSFTRGVLGLARVYRDHVISMPKNATALETAHSLWHPAYLGLGYLPNRYGIQWQDIVGYNAAKRVDPGVVYLSPHYNAILRHLYFHIARADPGFVAHTYFVKFAETMHAGLSRFWLPLILLPLAVSVGRSSSRVAQGLVLLVPGLITTLIPPVLTIPTYITGWLGALGTIEVFVVAWICTNVGEMATRARSLQWQESLDRMPAITMIATVRAALDARRSLFRPAFVASLGVVVAAVVVLPLSAATGTVHARYAAEETRQADSAVPSPPPAGNRVYARKLNHLPADWSATVGTVIKSNTTSAEVRTTKGQAQNELASAPIRLKAGTYTVVLSGAVPEGGLTLAIADLKTQDIISSASYWSGQRFAPEQKMHTELALKEPARVQILLRNWQLAIASSVWLIRRVDVARTNA